MVSPPCVNQIRAGLDTRPRHNFQGINRDECTAAPPLTVANGTIRGGLNAQPFRNQVTVGLVGGSGARIADVLIRKIGFGSVAALLTLL